MLKLPSPKARQKMVFWNGLGSVLVVPRRGSLSGGDLLAEKFLAAGGDALAPLAFGCSHGLSPRGLEPQREGLSQCHSIIGGGSSVCFCRRLRPRSAHRRGMAARDQARRLPNARAPRRGGRAAFHPQRARLDRPLPADRACRALGTATSPGATPRTATAINSKFE